MRFFSYLITNFQQRYLSIRDHYRRTHAASLILILFYNLQLFMIILQIEKQYQIGFLIMKWLFSFSLIIQFGLLVAIFCMLSPLKFRNLENSELIRPIPIKASNNRHINKDVKKIFNFGVSFVLKIYIYIFSQLISWALISIIRQIQNQSIYIIQQANNSSVDIFYLVFSIIFQLSNILITFSLSNLECDLTFKNSDYLGTLFVTNLLRDVCLRQTIIIIITVLQNAQITSIVGITYFLLSSILSFQLQTYCQLYIDLLQSYFKFILGIFILQDYFKIRISQNIYSIILTAPILLKIIVKYYKQQREFCHLNKRKFITDQQLRLFYSQIEQYFLKKNQKFNKDKCRQKLSLNIYYQITNHLLNCDKRFNKVNSCFCVQYFPIIRSTMRNWNKYLESDDEENQNDVPKLVNDKKNLKFFLIQLISLQYETQIKDFPNYQYSHYYFLIQVLKRALKVFQNCQILKDKSRHFKQRLIINQLCDLSALKLKKQNQTTQSETSNMIVFQFQDSIEIMRMNLNQIFIQLQEFYQMLIDPYFDQQALTKLGEKIINNKDVFQNQLNETSRINAYDQNLQVLVRIYNTYVETQQYFNNHVQYQQPHQQILNKLFVTDSYVVVITFLNQLGAIINSTKNFTSLIQESNNLRGQNINQYMPSVIAQFHNQYLQNYLDGGQSNIIGKEQVYFLLKDSQSYIIPINIQVRIEYNLISEFGASALIQKASNFDNHLILINQFGIIQELNQNSYEFFNQHLKLDIDQIQNINLLMLIPGLHKLLKIKIQQVTSVEIQRPEEIIIIFPTEPIQIQALKSILLPSESKNINKYFDEQKGFIQRYLNQIHSAKIYNAKIIIQPLKITSQKLFVCDITNISIQEVHDLQKKIQSIQSLSFLGNRNQARSKNMIQAQIKSLKEFEVGNLEKNVINQEELMTKNIKYNLQNYSSSHFQLISNRTIIHSEQNLLSENISFTKQVSQQNYFMEEILEQKGMCDQNQSIQFSNGHQIDILSQTQSKSDYNFKEKLEIAFNVLFQNNSSYQFNIFRIFYALAYLTLLVINLIIFYQTITQYRFQWINESEDIYLKKTGNSINIFLLQEFQDELQLDDFQQQLLTDIKWFIQYFSNVQIMMEWKSEESQETFIYSLIEIYEHLIQQLEDGKLLSSVQSQYVNICDQINELYDVLEEHIDNKITDNKQIQIFLTILGYFLTSLTIISLIPVGIYISNGRDKIFQLINTFNIKDLYRCLYRFEHLQKLLDSKQLLNYNSQYDQQMNNLVSDKIQRLQNHRNKLTESRSQIWNKNLQKLLIMVILFSLSQLYLMITLIYQNSFFLAYEHNILKSQRILELKHGMSTCSAVISMIRIDEDSDASEFIQDALDLMKEEFEEQLGWKSIILEIDLGLNVTSSIEDNFCNIFYFDSDEIFNYDKCQQQGLIDDGLIQLLTRYFGQITEIFDYLENDSEFQVEEYLKTDQITLLQKQQIFIQHGLTILYNLQLKDLQQYSEKFKINEIILFVMSFCIFVIIMIIINKFIITYLVNLTFRARRLFTLIPMKLIVENLYVMNYVKNEGKYIIK